jgi:hypothetical protein
METECSSSLVVGFLKLQLLTISIIGVYLGSFIITFRQPRSRYPIVYRPIVTVLESRFDRPLRWTLEQSGINVDYVHCMSFE